MNKGKEKHFISETNKDKFYAFHNSRLFDNNEQQIASIGEPLFISIDITSLNQEEIDKKSNEIQKEYGFEGYIRREEDGKIYAVFQMFDDYIKAIDFLRNYVNKLGGLWDEVFGIFEQITENFETPVETNNGIITMRGKYVDNYYLKKVKAKETK